MDIGYDIVNKVVEVWNTFDVITIYQDIALKGQLVRFRMT